MLELECSISQNIRKTFLRKYEKDFNLGVRKFHYLKYREKIFEKI